MMSMLPKMICRFNKPYKNPNVFFFFFFKAGIEKPILKLIWDCKWPQITKTILKKKNKVRGLVSLDCGSRNSLKLASGWADGPLEYNRHAGNKPSHIWCYGLNSRVKIPNLEALIPIVMAFEGGAFKRQFSHEGGIFMRD